MAKAFDKMGQSSNADLKYRKRAEEALHASEHDLRLIIDSIPVFVWTDTAAGERPLVEVPTNFRAEPASSNASEAATTRGGEQWVEIFQDATLQRLVQEALQKNLDLRIAAQRVLEAQAQVGITRSQQLPSVSGGASYSALQIPSSLAGKNSDGSSANSFFNGGGLSASAAWT